MRSCPGLLFLIWIQCAFRAFHPEWVPQSGHRDGISMVTSQVLQKLKLMQHQLHQLHRLQWHRAWQGHLPPWSCWGATLRPEAAGKPIGEIVIPTVAYMLIYMTTFYLTSYLTHILTYNLTLSLTFYLTFYLPFYLTFYPTCILAFYSTF